MAYIRDHVVGVQKQMQEDKEIAKENDPSDTTSDNVGSKSHEAQGNAVDSGEYTHTQSGISKASECTFNKEP